MAAINTTLHPDWIECVICRETYKEPIDLKCGHSFCRKCIVEHAANNERAGSNKDKCCPVCRKRISFPAAKLRIKPVNYALKQIVEAVGLHKSKQTPVTTCLQHNKDHIFYCDTCKDVRCIKCFTETCKSDHEITELEEIAKELRQNIGRHLEETCNSKEENKIPSIVSDLRRLNTTKSKLINSKAEGLKQWLRLPHSELVKKRKKISEEVHPNGDIKNIDIALDTISEALKSVQDIVIDNHKDNFPLFPAYNEDEVSAGSNGNFAFDPASDDSSISSI